MKAEDPPTDRKELGLGVPGMIPGVRVKNRELNPGSVR